MSRPHEPAEHEADRAAEAVATGGTVAGWSFGAVPPAPPAGAGSPGGAGPQPTVGGGGAPLPPSVRRVMEARFGYDFAAVRIHTDPASAESVLGLGADAFATGTSVAFAPGRYDPSTPRGRRLLAHELAHVVQQGRSGARLVQRKVLLGGKEMTAKERTAFLNARKWTNKATAREVMDDMAAAGDKFDFADEAELTVEVTKRVSSAAHMIESQRTLKGAGGVLLSGFGYPFNRESALYGPRVNYAARDLWQPRPPDDYALRTDKEKVKKLLALPRYRRHEVYGDMSGLYSWTLTDKGKADPYSAISLLSVRQPAHKRSLLHCDYLISIVHFMSLADAIGKVEFAKRIKAFGPEKIRLRFDAFADLYPKVYEALVGGGTTARAGIGSLQAVRPSSKSDFVVGDHVMFFNHIAYDLINRYVGNAWRLENGILIRRGPKGKGEDDVFLGHGSGELTELGMRKKLAGEFNEVARQAITLTQQTKSKNKKVATEASAKLTARFPAVQRVAGVWRIVGDASKDLCPGVKINEKLRELKASEVPGSKDPCDPTKLYWVKRPVESYPGKQT